MHRPPLAESMRPRTLAEFVGQEMLVGPEHILRELIEQGNLPSLLLWGPPGCGKTTLAAILAKESGAEFVSLSGVTSGKSELLRVVEEAEKRKMNGQKTVLFIDEIHRWNKAQQDALLPFVEKGVVTLIGATTENPSFEVVRALLSRTKVFVLEALTTPHIQTILRQALTDRERGLQADGVAVSDEILQYIASLAGGDARSALNVLELCVQLARKKHLDEVSMDLATQAMQRTHVVFDKNGEEFYNAISALHKSMRGSDASAALYWLARMLEGGADPLYIARRVVRFASEDIGMANSEALVQTTAAFEACRNLGMPECAVHLAQAVVYCAKAKKSNALYVAYGRAASDAKRTSHIGVPLHLRNAPTALMKELRYGEGYKYNPDYSEPVSQSYLPTELQGTDYFSSSYGTL